MQGFVAVTDAGWYETLSRHPEPRDANFWRPSTRRMELAPGTPFFFKLKSPHNAIVGVGYFASFSVLPDWLVWSTFGEANGVASLDELRGRISRIQAGASIPADPQGRIGCSLIAEAQFFERSAWVAQPRDWGARTVVGATYDLTAGEGRRIWEECQQRMWSPAAEPVTDLVLSDETPRRGTPQLVHPRLGQGIFRVVVLDAYERACAVTQEHSLPVLEAAHIKSYARGGPNDVRNGLTLRTDVHRLFDCGYVTVDENCRFVVGRRLREDFGNGRSYNDLHGRELVVPAVAASRPSTVALAWHRENVFLG